MTGHDEENGTDELGVAEEAAEEEPDQVEEAPARS